MNSKIEAWSFSRWEVYAACPAKARYKFIDKLPEKRGSAVERGEAIHKAAEKYLVSGVRAKLPDSLAKYAPEFAELKRHKPECEQPLALSKDFGGVVDWFSTDAWCRAKMDAIVVTDHVRIVDFKTGRVYPEKHELQASLYALFGLRLYGAVVDVEFWYVDIGPEVTFSRTYGKSPHVLRQLMRQWDTRTRAMLSDAKFAPRPHDKCRFCAFSIKQGGPCRYG